MSYLPYLFWTKFTFFPVKTYLQIKHLTFLRVAKFFRESKIDQINSFITKIIYQVRVLVKLSLRVFFLLLINLIKFNNHEQTLLLSKYFSFIWYIDILCLHLYLISYMWYIDIFLWQTEQQIDQISEEQQCNFKTQEILLPFPLFSFCYDSFNYMYLPIPWLWGGCNTRWFF